MSDFAGRCDKVSLCFALTSGLNLYAVYTEPLPHAAMATRSITAGAGRHVYGEGQPVWIDSCKAHV